jgi:type IV pilus assembly protein PilW
VKWNRRYPEPSAGFSMVELMVGLIISMVSVLVILQVFAVSESQKRTVMGSGDANITGTIALQILQRDMRMSGWGINPYVLLGCNVVLRAGITLNGMVPVTLNHASIPAGDPATDTVLVVYGNAHGLAEGDTIKSPSTSPNYTATVPQAFQVNDRVIAEPLARPNPCTLTLTTVTAKVGSNLTVGGWAGGMVNGKLFNLGQAPVVRAYAIRGGNLTVCDYLASNCGDPSKTGDATVWVPIASGIVSLRAEYGRDTLTPLRTGVSTTYPYRADTFDQASPATACGWIRTPVVRLALTARSGAFEKPDGTTTSPIYATNAAPTWEGSANTPIDLTRNPDGTTNPNWQNYRYKVFQTVVPLRNITSTIGQTGC